ncbi:putative berberine bridge enzyme [Mariannaea sp. PMI_226]|nr:putative berberine bridge enzyme [Mariannaea sp. PMI_226]
MGGGQSSPRIPCLDAICASRTNCVAYPGEPLYQVSWVKPYNLAHPVSPAAVLRPNDTQEVSQAVRCAKQHGLKVQAKSGGHSYGYTLHHIDGALALDLTNLKSFNMNVSNWQATVGAGMHLGELDNHLRRNGKRAMAHGTCPSVGIGGHATIGGLGPMSRMWGSTLDHVVEVEVVTADGKIQRASKWENNDLFWAIRGAGASLGIVTEFVMTTHPEPEDIVEYTYVVTPASQSKMAPLFQQWQKLIEDPSLDRRFSSLFIVQRLGAMITGTFYGTEEEYKKSGIPDRIPGGGKNGTNSKSQLKDWRGSLAHQQEMEFVYLSDIQSAFYTKSLAFRREDLLSNNTINDLFEYMHHAGDKSLPWTIIFNSEGGAIADTSTGDTAYPHRDKIMMYQSYGVGLLGVSDLTREYLDGVHDKIKAGAPQARSTYAGYIDTTITKADAQRLYWGSQLPRLGEVKKKWDPDDIFSNPQSVQPSD